VSAHCARSAHTARPVLVATALALALTTAAPSRASEFASSHRGPGGTRPFAVAVAPPPGLRIEYAIGVDHVSANVAVHHRFPELDLEVEQVLGTLRVGHAFERRLLGGRFELEAAVPYGWLELEAGSGPFAGQERDRFAFGDLTFAPLSYYWSRGRVHLNFAHRITAPIGRYSERRTVDIGRNHWSFDTALAASFVNERSGSELSASLGWLTNTRNDATRFDSGDEIHIDAMLNQWIATNFALGAHGYYVDQVSADRIGGSAVPALEGRAAGVGAAALWTPDAFDRHFAFEVRWLHDLEAQGRLEGERITFAVRYSTHTY